MRRMLSHTFTALITGIVLLLPAWPSVTHADIAADLNNFFNSAGLLTNTTPPGVYEGQTAGYYTAGGVFARAPARNFNLVTVQAPSFRAGCGGIDIYSGGFSFVNSDQLVAAMRNIGQNALGLAFQIGLSTLSPKLAELVQEFTTLANKVNQFNINSCETAANLLGSVMPKTDKTQKALCGLIGSNQGIFQSYAQAQQECGAGGRRSSVVNSARTNPTYKDLITTGNLTWRALKKNTITLGDDQLAEFLMTLAGTAILPPTTNDDQPRRILTYPPLPVTDEILEAFLEGGAQVRLPFLYRCADGYGEQQCTQITKVANYAIPSSFEGFQTRVHGLLMEIIDGLDSDQAGTNPALSPAALNLIGNSRIPILKALTVFHGYSPRTARSQAVGLSKLIALDLLDLYLSQTYDMARQSVESLPMDDATDRLVDRIRDQQMAMSRLIQKRSRDTLSLIDLQMQLMTFERAAISRLSPGLVDAYKWGMTVQ